MPPDKIPNAQLNQAHNLRQLAESTRRQAPSAARKHYEEAVALLRQLDEPLILAHTLRHLGDVYHEQKSPTLAEPSYLEALELYRLHEKIPSLDLANALRSLAVFRGDQAKALWEEARALYTTLHIALGIKEATNRLAAFSKT